MHRCFKIPEIVQEICQHLGHDPFWYLSQAEAAISRRALAHLSRTCSQFQKPATEELWSRIGSSYGLEPLLDAIADDLWDYNAPQGKRNWSSRRLKREINYSDIMSFKQIASRIRRLCILVQASSMASIRSLAAITVAATPDDGFLFPRLQELRLLGPNPLEDITTLSVIFGPAISVLRITVPLMTNYKNLSFLASVARRCPNLAEVTFGNSIILPSRSFHVPHCRLRSLRTLELMIDSAEAVVTLSYLPLLEGLTMTIASSSNITNNSMATITGGGGFPSLTRLSCCSCLDLSPCLWAIDLLTTSTLLESLFLSSKRPAPLGTVGAIIELLPRRVNHFTLELLHITESEEVQQGAIPSVEAATELLEDPLHLECLQEFHSLKYLRVQVMTPISTGIQPLLALGHLDLEALVVGCFGDPVYGQCTPKIKLQDLTEILDAFPNLTALGLPIDATVVPSCSKRPGKGFEHEEVLLLLVGSSPIQSPQNVAEFLSDIVPELDGISVPQNIVFQNGRRAVENPNAAKWEKVEELVPFLARIREQERNTAYFGHSESDEE
ncbi:hypothetical protein BKA70DRAFT_1475048 [Coprinopsis sp. MPI-PUGE-AT-0042]|nr:hypothetical protein BKA70DRAFT_1475048 [Coprinopsis sp. MPI-PUGE-AT-0042]